LLVEILHSAEKTTITPTLAFLRRIAVCGVDKKMHRSCIVYFFKWHNGIWETFANQLCKSLRDLKSGMVQTERNNLFHRQNSFVYNNLLTTLGNVRGNSAVFGN
jgi:hypothetical protein